MRTSRILPVAATLAAALLAGCHVTEHKDGDNKNVSIGTPFGSMNVKTNDKADTSAIGVSVYPGSTPYKEDNDSDTGSADVNLNFGDFHLGVKAASYITPDSQDKVIAFYQKDMARYGTVIECRDGHAVSQPDRTAQGLTCSDDDHASQAHTIHVHHDGDLELRTGSDQHQHIVGLREVNGRTKIGLVALDLPSHLGGHGKDDVE
jgi:hypothetical protein